MSGGRLVVLDRAGRPGKVFPLPAGAATLGRAPTCDIRVLLPAISPHHADIVVLQNQAVVRNVGSGSTLVNGRAVSVAALRHEDVVSLGGRRLRWEYERPALTRAPPAEPVLCKLPRPPRAPRRATAASLADAVPKIRALDMHQRASMPGNAGGKQVAIVQPQRRDTGEPMDTTAARSAPNSPRSPNRSRGRADTELNTSLDGDERTRAARVSPKNLSLQNTTKATLWIESRKTSPRKSPKATPPRAAPAPAPARAAVSARKRTPLRMAVLRRAQSAHKGRVTKIEAPLKIDHMKQAALMLMTGHRAKLASPKDKKSPKGARTPRLVVKKQSPRSQPRSAGGRKSGRRSQGKSVSVLEITDNTTHYSTGVSDSDLSQSEVTFGSPKKSALKDPKAKKSLRKTESIKFDLSNLENHQDDDILMVTASARSQADSVSFNSVSEDDLMLHYSDTSSASVQSPSPRRSIHSSRSSRIIAQAGSPLKDSLRSEQDTLTPEYPPSRKSSRGSVILQKNFNDTAGSRYSRRTTKTITDQSFDTTAESAFQTRTLSPRSKKLESYSIVDLVSINSNESTKSSVYDSVGSTRSSSILFGTPQASGRKTRSTINPSLLTSSTPYVGKARVSKRSSSIPNITRKSSPNKSLGSVTTRRSKSLTTPENSEETQKHISINSTRISRVSKSRSRINDSELQFITTSVVESESPRTSRRNTRADQSMTKSPSPKQASLRQSPQSSFSKSPQSSPQKSPIASPRNKRSSQTKLTLNVSQTSSQDEGTITPENKNSPEEAGTPVLSIQSLLNSSQSSFASQRSPRQTRTSMNIKRKTIGALRSDRKKIRTSPKSKSFTTVKTARKSLRSVRLTRDSDDGLSTEDDNVTPKSGVKLVQEAVKNKHSTAKKPQSKRSIIDSLNQSDIVKQLFNSPVKRKLSQSMTEFSRKKLFDDDEEIVVKRPTRKTIALTGRTPDNSILEHTARYTPENFVSPLSTPSNSPNLTGIKRLFRKNTPDNDLSNIKGVKTLLQSPRTRKSVKNDLTNISGVKEMFAKSPQIRLNDVLAKEVSSASPKKNLTRVSGVRSLFQSEKKRKSLRNDLSDVRGVKKLFTRKSVANDLRNVSGVKKTLQYRSPRNDLRDVRGVKRLFRQDKQNDQSHNLSGVEELFNESNVSSTSYRDSEALFDQLIGKPPIKAVYSKSFIAKRPNKRKPRAKSLHTSIDLITNNVEEWIEQELQKHLHKDKKLDKSDKTNVSRELQKLATDTVEGLPMRTSRVRNSTLTKSHTDGTLKKSASEVYGSHTLPIKKRSFVEASLEKSKDNSLANKAILPIKKRAVVHSTPVKERYNLTMNASELGRVSPIAVVDKTQNVDTENINRTKQQTPKQKGKRATIPKIVEEPSTNVVKTPEAPPKTQVRTRKARNETENIKTETQPQTQKRNTRNKTLEVAPKPTRATKSKVVIEKPENPKVKPQSPKTKGRKTKASVSEETTPVTDAPTSPKPKRGRPKASTAEVTVAPVVEPKTRRTKSNTKKAVPIPTPKKGRKGAKTKTPVKKQSPPKKTLGSKAKPSPEKATRSLRNKNETVANTKKRRASLVITKKPPVMSPQNKRSRNVKAKIDRSKKSTPPVRSPQAAPQNKRSRNVKAKIDRSKKSTPPVRSPQAAPQNNRSRNVKAKLDRSKKSTPPVRSLQAAPQNKRSRNVKAKIDSPKRSTPQKVEKKVKSPKATRARLVVAKPSPKLNPRGVRAARSGTDSISTKKESPQETQVPTRRGRRNADTQNEPKNTQKVTRQKTPTPKKGSSKKSPNTPEPKKTSKNSSPKKVEVKKPTTKKVEFKKSTPKTSEIKVSPKNATPKKSEPSPPAKRGRQTVQKPEIVEPPAKRGRAKTKESPKPLSPKKTRGRNLSQENAQSSSTKTNRRTKIETPVVIPEPQRGRKRKVVDDQSPVPSKVAKNDTTKATRGRKTVVNAQTEVKGKPKSSPVKAITTRNKKDSETHGKEAPSKKQPAKVQKSPPKVEKAGRGRKAAVVESAPTKVALNKRKAASPVKIVQTTRSSRRR